MESKSPLYYWIAYFATFSGIPNSSSYDKLSYDTDSLLPNLEDSYNSSSISTDKSSIYEPCMRVRNLQ